MQKKVADRNKGSKDADSLVEGSVLGVDVNGAIREALAKLREPAFPANRRLVIREIKLVYDKVPPGPRTVVTLERFDAE